MIARYLLLALLVACTRKPTPKIDLETHSKHPVRSAGSHPLASKPSLVERADTAPELLIAYLKEENALQGFKELPRPHVLTADEQRVVTQTLHSLPPEVARLALRATAAIYFVDDLGGTGWTDMLRDDPQRRSILAFDASVLSKRANDWATDKERSVFKLGADVRVVLAPEETNTEGSAFRFILLHELGHAIGTHVRAYPAWGDAPAETTFTKVSWRLQDKSFVALQPPWPGPLGFYGVSPPLATTDVPNVYAKMKDSAFPSLYASVRVDDDFAETFALYVHTVLLKQPHITLVSGDTAIIDCLEAPQCKLKRAFVSQLLQE